jgi:putative ABC transport system permease protein
MFDFDKWQEIFHSIQRHKLRTLLTAFGVFWGIFMLVLLLGAGRGIEKGTYAEFGNFAKNSVFLWGGRTQIPYKGLNPGRWIRLRNDDIEAIRETIPEAKYIATLAYLGDSSVMYKEKDGSFTIIGLNSEAIYIETPRLEGRFINVPDNEAKRKVAVIGKQVQKMLFAQEDPIGKYITIRGVLFQVVGVFEPTGSGNEREAEQIYIPVTTLQSLFYRRHFIGNIAIIAEDNVPASVVETKVKDLLKRRHKVAPEDERGIGSWNAEKEFSQFQGLFRGIRIFIWIVGAGTIVAGIVGVSNVMLIIIKERTREIGIRKALGATPFSIISLILQESVFLTAVSGYTGLVVSVSLIELVGYLMDTFHLQSPYFNNPEIDFAAAITATIILVITGALAGLIPARTAAAINPIEALRSE